MSGDYIYFLSDDENYASVAVADVIGKGIPAALCMSMIKFGMDSMQNENSSPHIVLDVVNRIVEESVDDSMFISMFYGKYEVDGSPCFPMLPQAMNQLCYIKLTKILLLN